MSICLHNVHSTTQIPQMSSRYLWAQTLECSHMALCDLAPVLTLSIRDPLLFALVSMYTRSVTSGVSNSATLWIVAHRDPLSMGILQASILDWVAMPASRASSQPRDWTWVSCIASRFFTTEPPGKPPCLGLHSSNPQLLEVMTSHGL